MRNFHASTKPSSLTLGGGLLGGYATVKNTFDGSLSYRSNVVRPVRLGGFKTASPYYARRHFVDSESFQYTSSSYDGAILYGTSHPTSKNTGVLLGTTGVGESVAPITGLGQIAYTQDGAAAKVSNSDFNLGIALGELGDSINFVSGMSIRVLKALKATRRKLYYDAVRHLDIDQSLVRGFDFTKLGRKHLADDWLQLQFGWLPILADIRGVIETIRKDWNFDSPVLSSVRNKNFDNTALIPLQDNERIVSGGLTTGISTKYFYTIEDRVVYLLNSLGLANPMSLAWDLTPLSFTVDWFIPVGTWLSNMTAFNGTKYLGGYTTVHNSFDVTIEYEVPGYPYRDGKLPRYHTYGSVWRRYPHPLGPALRLLPTFRPSFNVRKAASALALISNSRYS